MDPGELCSSLPGRAWLPDAAGRTSLSGFGCAAAGPYLLVDALDREPWQRHSILIRGRTFTLTRCEERHCTGRHDLATGRGMPCPDRIALGSVAHEQCAACFTATGFNPAFYNSPHVSQQQCRRNLEPHDVYLVSFGVGLVKVGMTHEPRRLSRLLEQGARLGTVIASLPTADAARELEADIVRGFGVAESVRAARKRQLLGVPLRVSDARAELVQMLARIAASHSHVDAQAPVLTLDQHYFGTERLPSSLTDLSETYPHCISGRCIGLIGDVLVVAQRERHYMLSIGESQGCRVQLEALERENRFVGQLGLPF